METRTLTRFFLPWICPNKCLPATKMGSCYSKSAHGTSSMDKQKSPKETKKGSLKNGHFRSKKDPKPLVEGSEPVKIDVSDTLCIEEGIDKWTPNTEDCLNNCRPTSLSQTARDSNKNCEMANGFEVSEVDSCDVVDGKLSNADSYGGVSAYNTCLMTESCHVILDRSKLISDSGQVISNSDQVSTSDSGVVGKSCSSCENSDVKNKQLEHINTIAINNIVADVNNTGVDELITEAESLLGKTHSCFCSNSQINDASGQKSPEDHSSPNHIHGECQELDSRQSLASIDRVCEPHQRPESVTDLNKIKLVLQKQSLEQRSLLDCSENSFNLPASVRQQQPHVMTVTIDGREVVVIEADLFSQIIEEIHHLKMRLSQLTVVIQDADEDNMDVGVLGSSVSS